MPQAIPEAPAATPDLSTSSTSWPSRARCQAVERPCTPAPMTRVGVEVGRRSDTVSSRLLRKAQHGWYKGNRKRSSPAGEGQARGLAIGPGAWYKRAVYQFVQ